MIAPAFPLLWDGYPDGPAAAVLHALGGEFAKHLDWNTCAMRMSMALLNAGARLHGSHALYTLPGGKPPYKGVPIALRQRELSNHLRRQWGEPTVFQNPGGAVPAEASALQGVISFFGIPGYLGGAGGHIDVWDGSLGRCKHDAYWNAHEAWIWAF